MSDEEEGEVPHPGRTMEGFLEEAASECGLERCQESRERILGLCAKHLDDISELDAGSKTWRPHQCRTTGGLTDASAGLCSLSRPGSSEGTWLRSVRSKSDYDPLRSAQRLEGKAPPEPQLFPKGPSLPVEWLSINPGMFWFLKYWCTCQEGKHFKDVKSQLS